VDPRPAPNLVEHPRTADEIAAVLGRLLNEVGPARPGTDLLREALVQIAARYGEIVTQCLNAAPNLHLKTFSELLGVQARPAEAARVHLSFKPAAGGAGRPDEAGQPAAASRPVTLPMYSRVAAQAAGVVPVARAGTGGAGTGEPPVFETLAELELVRAETVRAYFVDAGHRRFADVAAIASEPGFDADLSALLTPVTYALHISQPAAFGLPGVQQVKVQVEVLDSGSPDPASRLEWIVPAPKGDLQLEVARDSTGGLAHSGEVVLVPPPAWPAATVDGMESLWLTLRLSRLGEAAAPAQRWRPPRLAALRVVAVAATGPQTVTAACSDGVPLDISKDVFPFGERPRFGVVFQVLSPTFGEPGAKVELIMQHTNPVGATAAPIAPVSREGRPAVVWEIATASGFQMIAVEDGTQSLTQDGSVVFTVPNDVAGVTLAGKRGTWLRARLASGHYGTTVADGTPIPVMRSPALRSLAVRSTLERVAPEPEHLVSQGAFTSRRVDPPVSWPIDAFPPPDVDGPALYIGLGALGPGEPFNVLGKGQVIAWHVRPKPPTPPPVLSEPAAGAAAPPRWQMRSVSGWHDTAVRDDSAGLTRSGIVTLTLQDQPGRWFGSMLDPAPRRLAWLRVLWPADPASPTGPRLPIGVAVNSVAARHSQRLTNEIVGSSNGRSDQVFKALRTPIIGDVLLQVRETDDEWVTWNEVDSLTTSRPDALDFELSRSTGEMRFGDGRCGRIPPLGANNVRLTAYSTGGGRGGNQPAKAISQQRSAVPAVESGINLEPATGGLDAEDAARVRDHASAWLRHRDRAICQDDFADLALKASPEIARAFCIPGRDLAEAVPAGTRELQVRPGVVSVVVIPCRADPCPQPSLDLLATVRAYLDARRTPASRLVIGGPIYTKVAVKLEVRAKAEWSAGAVAAACKLRVAAFLHPLTGGPDGTGWALGQRPHRSDLYGLFDSIDGVDFVRGLSVSVDLPVGMPIIVAAGPIAVEPCQ
jgi:Baseplate J-like protein